MAELLKHIRLPYPQGSLAPVLSLEAVRLHLLELHAGYVDRANKLIRKADKDGLSRAGQEVLRFNANGALLHDLWWLNLRPEPRPGIKSGPRKRLLDTFGGSTTTLKKELVEEGLKVQGSGWVCLSVNEAKGYTEVHAIKDHDYDWHRNMRPILVLDVWEHAYLLNYGGDRKAYLKALWKLIDWDEVERRLGTS